MTPSLPASSRQTYLRLLGYVRPFWKAFIVAVIGMALTAATEPVLPALFKFLLDSGFAPADQRLVYLIPIGLVGLFLVRGLVVYLTGYVMAWITSNIVMTLRNALFGKLLTLPTRYYNEQSSGAMISKVVYDVNNIADASSSALISVVRESLTVVGLIGYLVYMDWKLTLIALSVGPFITTVVRRFGKRLRSASRSGMQAMGLLTHILEEATGGHKVVKIFGGQTYENQRFQDVNAQFRRSQMREAIPASATVPITHLASVVAVSIIIYIALRQSTHPGGTTVGGFISFISAMLMLLAPVKRLTEVNSTLQRGLAAAESIFSLLDQPSEDDRGTRQLGRARGEVRFEHVGFQYPGQQDWVGLTGIDLAVRAGETIALVGASGSGKSTLVSLLPRFYSPTQGRVLIDGVDTQDLQLASLRENIALVSQDVVLFNDTLAANIAYGSTQHRSEAEIIAAAKAAYAWDFIQEQAQGLQTQVGENGAKLSGGQRQRIAIARALLKDAPILILDEATSALDTESERQVQAALAVLMQGRTTFVIAHRLSTIEGADRILVMDRGRIAESGQHAELLARGGLYAHLHGLQFREEKTAVAV